MTPTFSAISDLYSPTQLRRALVEAEFIARTLMDCLECREWPTKPLRDSLRRLGDAVEDVKAVDAPKAQEVGNG